MGLIVEAARQSLQRRVARPLVIVALGLTLVSLVVLRLPGLDVLRDRDRPWVDLLDVRSEANLHTWYNVTLLAVAAAAFLAVVALVLPAGSARWPWLVAAALCAILSVDDLVGGHEHLEQLGRDLGGGSGALHFAWIVPGVALAAGAVGLGLLAARRLPPRVRTALLAGVLGMVVAGLGLETLGGWIIDRYGSGVSYVLVSHLEEFVETLAAICLLVAPLRAVRNDRGTVTWAP